jgi:hypothetical protein
LIENTAAYYQQNACSEEERQGQRQTHSKMAILKEKLVTYLNIEDDSSSKYITHFGMFLWMISERKMLCLTVNSKGSQPIGEWKSAEPYLQSKS